MLFISDLFAFYTNLLYDLFVDFGFNGTFLFIGVKMIFKGLLILCMFVMSGCTKTIQGYRFSPAKDALVQVGESNISDVVYVLGNPTTKDVVEENRIVLTYAQSQYSSFLFVRKKMISRRIVVYYFDKNGILEAKKNFSLADQNYFRPTVIDVRLSKPNKLWALPFYLIV